MQPKLERVEVKAIGSGDHDFAVDHTAPRQRIQQLRVQLGKIAIQGLQIATLDVHIGAAAEHDRPKAVPLRLEQVIAGLGDVVRDFGEHGFDRRRNGKAHIAITLLECGSSGAGLQEFLEQRGQR